MILAEIRADKPGKYLIKIAEGKEPVLEIEADGIILEEEMLKVIARCFRRTLKRMLKEFDENMDKYLKMEKEKRW